MKQRNKLIQTSLICVLGSMMIGCSTLSVNDDVTKHHINDPYENFNRKVYAFNSTADKYVLKPLAKGYDVIVPDPVDTAIGNFFSNLTEPRNAVNNLLQGKLNDTATSVGRFAINSTVGLLGLLDVASKIDIQQKDEDFGQTLAAWGVDSGPYIMLPFLGPSTVRGTLGLTVDRVALDPVNEVDDSATETGLRVLRIIDLRQGLLGLDDVLEQQVDPYSFIKNGYQQRRIDSLYDGNAPEVEIDDF